MKQIKKFFLKGESPTLNPKFASANKLFWETEKLLFLTKVVIILI